MAGVITMHQPNYLPWIGLFSKIAASDCLILYDEAQYTSHGIINRNKIRTPAGWGYLTIPINRSFFYAKISEVPLSPDSRWQKDHWQTIYQNYIKAPFFKDYWGFFEDLYQQNFPYLWQLNEQIILYLLKCFDIEVEVIRTTQLTVKPGLQKTDLIIAYLKAAGANVYISGPSGRNYLEPEKFSQNNVELKFSRFQHPVYSQRYPGFEPFMSAIDLLFNMGPKSKEIIRSSWNIEDFVQTKSSECCLCTPNTVTGNCAMSGYQKIC